MAGSIGLIATNIGRPALMGGGRAGRVGRVGGMAGPCLSIPWASDMVAPAGVSGGVRMAVPCLPALWASRWPAAALDSGLSFLFIPTEAQALALGSLEVERPPLT